ncbi:MAG: NAD-dependent epimerase/dehydratase family protein [archaeon]
MSSILVTGGCGFIGNYVIDHLKKRGYNIIVADNLSKKESRVPNDVKFVNIDLRDRIKTEELFRNIDICINMASLIGGIGYFNKFPATILSENNEIFTSTFQAAVKNKIKRMIYISSSMVFESASNFPHKESDIDKIPPPLTGYGMSKLIGEYYCRAFSKEHGLRYTIIRPFNAYGINEYPGDYVGYAHVIPDLIKKILSGQYPLEILGNGNQTRCFTHVSDISEGIVMAMESVAAVDQDFNLGSPMETRIIDLAKMLWLLCDNKKEFNARLVPAPPIDIKRRVPDISKAQKILGWTPEIKLQEGLKEVVDWHKSIMNH